VARGRKRLCTTAVGKLFQIHGPTHLIENIRVLVWPVLQRKS